MNKFINKIYIKALVGANMAKNELQKMREEDEGLDIISTHYPGGCWSGLGWHFGELCKENRQHCRLSGKSDWQHGWRFEFDC